MAFQVTRVIQPEIKDAKRVYSFNWEVLDQTAHSQTLVSAFKQASSRPARNFHEDEGV